MPIELFMKQLKTFNDVLFSYAKRQFSIPKENKNSTCMEPNNIMRESCDSEEIKDLVLCQKK